MDNSATSETNTLTQKALKSLALAAAGKSGADIERVIREVRQKARREERRFNYDDVMLALKKSQSNMGSELLWRIAVHESGHALAITLYGIADVQTISIGTGEGGFVDSIPKEGIIENAAWLQKLLACLLAGRAAEKLIFSDTIIGSGGTKNSDLARATTLAINAETSFGIGQTHPLNYRDVTDSSSILSLDKQLASNVHNRLEKAEIMASEILNKHKDQLLMLATHLSQEKVMDGAEVRDLLKQSINDEEITPTTNIPCDTLKW